MEYHNNPTDSAEPVRSTPPLDLPQHTSKRADLLRSALNAPPLQGYGALELLQRGIREAGQGSPTQLERR